MTTGDTGRTLECDIYTLQPVWSCQTLRTGGLCVCPCLSVPKWRRKGEPSLPRLADGSETSFSGNLNYILSQPLMAVNLRPGRLSKPSPQSNNEPFSIALMILPNVPVPSGGCRSLRSKLYHVCWTPPSLHTFQTMLSISYDYMVSLALMVVHLLARGSWTMGMLET